MYVYVFVCCVCVILFCSVLRKVIFNHQSKLYPAHACKEYNEQFPALFSACHYRYMVHVQMWLWFCVCMYMYTMDPSLCMNGICMYMCVHAVLICVRYCYCISTGSLVYSCISMWSLVYSCISMWTFVHACMLLWHCATVRREDNIPQVEDVSQYLKCKIGSRLSHCYCYHTHTHPPIHTHIHTHTTHATHTCTHIHVHVLKRMYMHIQ